MTKGKVTGRVDHWDDGEGPYSVVTVEMQIRIVDDEITRSRLAVYIYPEPAVIRRLVRGLSDDQVGEDDSGDFCVCLSGGRWTDLNHEYPRFDPGQHKSPFNDDVERMNEIIRNSVDLVLKLHKEGMNKSRRKKSAKSGSPHKSGNSTV